MIELFTQGFFKDLMIWILGILAFWGFIDLYMMWRMRRSGYIDQTAAIGNWFSLKWALASRAEIVAEKLPFLKKDLTEIINVKADDGKTT
mgnify:CR=1 FL=1